MFELINGESEQQFIARWLPLAMEGTDEASATVLCQQKFAEQSAPDLVGEMSRAGRMHGVAAGHYPEVDMSEPLPRSLQPRHNRAAEIDGLTEVKQP